MATTNTDHSSGVAFVVPKTSDYFSPRTCTHCNKSGHDIASCFQLIGYPEWWEKNKPATIFSVMVAATDLAEASANQVVVEEATAIGLVQGEEVMQLIHLSVLQQVLQRRMSAAQVAVLNA